MAASSFAIEVPASLLDRARAGDRTAFEQLYRWFERPVFTLALRICGDRAEADEVLQDTMLKVLCQVDGYRGMRHGQCVAIDLVISGTRPEVYDPPRQAPLPLEQAQARLREALAGLQWTEPGGAALVQ